MKRGVAKAPRLKWLLPSDYPRPAPIHFPTLAAKVQADFGLAGIKSKLQLLQFLQLLEPASELGSADGLRIRGVG